MPYSILSNPVTAHVIEDIDESTQPGDVQYGNSSVWYICPCGCGTLGFLSTHDKGTPRPPGKGPYWELDRTTISLAPSVHHIGHWHGWLMNGKWTQA